MFHLYFGAFDIVLYTGAIYTAMALSKAICDDLENKATQETANRAHHPNHSPHPRRRATVQPG